MKESKFYTCEYCSKEFEPKRRRVQKYCTDTCRSKAFYSRKTNDLPAKIDNKLSQPQPISPTPTKNKIDSMSTSGVGNAAIGTLLADGLKAIATSNKNKPATKGDLDALKNLLTSRYLPINNLQLDQFGNRPYYDVEMKCVVYLKG